MSAAAAQHEGVQSRWMAAMRRGDFEAAWRETDHLELPRRAQGRAAKAGGPPFHCEPHQLVWNGESFEGRRVLVRCHHGLGDTLQFLRFVPRIREVAKSVTVLVQPPLVELLAGSSEFGEVRNGWTDEPPPEHDVAVEIMEVAYAFRSTPATLPRDVPYLPAPRATVRIDKGRSGLRVGLLWAASAWDTTRSIPLRAFEPLTRVPGTQFFSLQQGNEAGEWRDSAVRLEPLSEQTRTIPAAAAALLQLDLLITVDSMIAHLAGAFGRPVWVLLQKEADWRWMDDREDSPWYPTMRLFRQQQAGEWSGVVERVAAALEPLALGAR